MQPDLVNITLGFIEGFALIISPCILPILPIILAGSLEGSKKRPVGIIIGFMIVFALFTLFSRKLVQYSGIDLNIIRHISFGILILLAIIMLSTYLTDKFAELTRHLTNAGSTLSTANNPQGGLVSGILFGGLVAIIWTPCAGPILAAVIVQTVIQQTNLMSFLTLLAFGLGAGIPMLVIALFGRTLMAKLSFLKSRTTILRKLLGLIIIFSVGYMIFIEGGINTVRAADTNNVAVSLQNGLSEPYAAPPIAGIDAWVNSQPLQLQNLKGKVVLIDFWTYSCINCIRTLPYLKDWYDKYHDKGLIIIGVHTPEFDFEKNLTNVKNAVQQDGIKYPVALDSHFVTWLNFKNQYWPAHYLLDKNGNVVYTHFGEGDYDITENNIRYLLGLKEITTNVTSDNESFFQTETPETYLGYARADSFESPESVSQNQNAQYTFPETLAQHSWALQGGWNIMSDRILATQNNSSIEIHFHARNVYIVMGNSTNKSIQVKLLLNDNSITTDMGKDVVNSSITVYKHTLYEALHFNQATTGILKVISSTPGLEVYTFTFGK